MNLVKHTPAAYGVDQETFDATFIETLRAWPGSLAGQPLIVMGPRVGASAGIARTHEILLCEKCGHALWTSSDLVDTARGRDMKVVVACNVCVEAATTALPIQD
jgi:hypothetical protein